jgi:DNA-binding CsgD family transcriptional regulator
MGGAGSATAENWLAEDPLLLLPLESARLTARVFAGALREPVPVEFLCEEDAGWESGMAEFCAHRAQLSRLRGEIREAVAWGREGARRRPRGTCLGELAHATALAGDLVTAQRALAESRPGPMTTLARPWVQAMRGDPAGAVRVAHAAADDPGLGGYEIFALHDVVRLGAADLVADRLAGLAARWEGALAPLLARHAAACAARDGTELDAVSAGFEGLGMLLYAAEAAVHAAGAHLREGDERRARAGFGRARRLSDSCQGACTPALVNLRAPGLTARQRQIARLAASGLTNREIAEQLDVSVRTVGNHLCGIYERLGVSDRDGLTRLLGPG